MFGLPVLAPSEVARGTAGLLFGEFVTTFGLLAVIWGCVRSRSSTVPFAVGAYVAATFLFASSSFGNPAVALARAATPSVAGIRLEDALAFLVVQVLAAFAATAVFRWLSPSLRRTAREVVVEREE